MIVHPNRTYITDRWTPSDDIMRLIGAIPGKHYVAQDIQNIASLDDATEADIVFCWSKSFASDLARTRSKLVVLAPALVDLVPTTLSTLVVKNPKIAFAALATHLYPSAHELEAWEPGDPSHFKGVTIHKTASIHPTAVIGEGTVIDAGVVIGPHVTIGKKGKIFSNATLSHTNIGDQVTIGSGAVIGKAGFGFVPTPHGLIDLPHLGRVTIGNHVRIGANTTIDRGLVGPTMIGDGCRIDNLVQIAHNVHLGPCSVIVAQVGIAGSTRVGEGTMMGGQAGISDHLVIGKNVKIAAQSGVMRAINDNETVGGTPAIPIKEWHRQTLALQRLIQK